MIENPYAPLVATKKVNHQQKASYSFWNIAWQRLQRNPLAIFALASLIFIVMFASIGPYICPHKYFEINLTHKNLLPCASHWLGTDDLGRDLFARLAKGTGISLIVGCIAALLDLFIGIGWGAVAAFIGGRCDAILMRFVDILETIPYLLIIIGLIVVLEPGIKAIIIAMVITSWIPTARIVRAQILKTKHQNYVIAAKTLGAGFLHILRQHLLPSTIGPLIVTMTLTIPLAIFTEAILSFLGLGIQTPIASLGTLANDGLESLRFHPWHLLLPATLITWMILSFTCLSDQLKLSFDPKILTRK